MKQTHDFDFDFDYVNKTLLVIGEYDLNIKEVPQYTRNPFALTPKYAIVPEITDVRIYHVYDEDGREYEPDNWAEFEDEVKEQLIANLGETDVY